MRPSRRIGIRLAIVAAVAGPALVVLAARGPSAQAQCRPGEFALHQDGTVGWAWVSPDQSEEWWAYIEGLYSWADQSSVGANAWRLDAEYIGAGNWTSFESWQASVLSREETSGRTVTFARHSVERETIEN